MGRGTRDPVVEEIRKGREIDKKMLKADEAMLEHFARGGLAIIGP